MDYITIDEIRSKSKIDIVETLSNDEIQDICNYVKMRIDIYCKQDFDNEISIEKRISGNGSYVLDLPKKLRTLNSISINKFYYDIIDFEIVENGWQLISDNIRFESGYLNIIINGDWGFENIDVLPQKIRKAAAILADYYILDFYKRDEENLLAELSPFQSETFGPYNYKLKDDTSLRSKLLAKGINKIDVNIESRTTGVQDTDIILYEFVIEKLNEGSKRNSFICDVI